MAVSLASTPQLWRERGHLFVVADGMGAHAAGELASQIAAENIPLTYHKLREEPALQAVVSSVEDANRRIYQRGQDSVDFHGMGTTCSCLLLLPAGAVAAHVGDSRVYRLRGTQLQQLTFDHSLVWEMGAAAQATEEQVPAYVPRNVITRSLGPHPTVKVDVEGPLPIAKGDRFLLCSDGLTGPLSADLIGMVISALPPVEAAQTLVDLANLLGGPDNISVVVVEAANLHRIEGGDKGDPDACAETLPLGTKLPIGSQKAFGSHWASPASVVGAVAVLAASAVLAWFGYFAAAAIGLVVALALGWTGMRDQRNNASQTSVHRDAPPRGKAPYRTYDVAPTGQKIEMLGEIVRQIEDLEAQQEWGFDWTTIHDDRNAALQAIGRSDYVAAVAHYSSAVRRLMQALRNGGGGPSDSTINLDED